jgi:hypothetical protein
MPACLPACLPACACRVSLPLSICSWVVFEDRCPHRLAPLSEGRLEPSTGQLMCSYHGARGHQCTAHVLNTNVCMCSSCSLQASMLCSCMAVRCRMLPGLVSSAGSSYYFASTTRYPSAGTRVLLLPLRRSALYFSDMPKHLKTQFCP